MEFFVVLGAIAVILVLAMGSVMTRGGRRGVRGPGAGATGAVYDMLNEDKRKAIEIIVENRAADRDHEHADDEPDPDPAKRTLR